MKEPIYAFDENDYLVCVDVPTFCFLDYVLKELEEDE